MLTLALVSIMASTVLCAVAYRLALLPRSERSMRCQLRWHSWVMAHVLIGTGCMGFITAPLCNWHVSNATLLTLFAGLALYFGPRWHRRSSDR